MPGRDKLHNPEQATLAKTRLENPGVDATLTQYLQQDDNNLRYSPVVQDETSCGLVLVVIHRLAALATCSLLLVLNYMNVGVFHPEKLPWITGVL